MSEFEIEEVRDIDAVWPEVEPLVLGIIEYHRPWDDRVPKLRADWADRMQEFMATSKDSVLFVARQKGKAVGFVHGHVTRDWGIFTQDEAFIHNAFVQEDARRLGVGTALLSRFEAWVREQGVEVVQLHVNAGNALGQQFWSKAGYGPVEQVLGKMLS
jgi:GNAT superfamily N-acetyltransferase